MNNVLDEKIKQLEILAIFDKRAKSSKIYLIILIYTLIIIVAFVFAGVFYTKNNDTSPLGKLVGAAIESGEKNDYAALNSIASSIQQSYLDQRAGSAQNGSGSLEKYSDFTPFFSKTSAQSSDSLASAIASLLISVSLMIFIGFVMKVIFVFIKYYMQLVADYENQKIAYILSEGKMDNFEKYLSFLRKSNIQFEKTPSPPQEKIILSLIDALKKKDSI